jgi:hypothetical protein
MAKRTEPFGATMAAIIGAVVGVLVNTLLPWEQFFNAFPVFPRILFFAAIVLFAWKAWSYWEILGGAEEPQDSPERADYDALVAELQAGGTPGKVYREWLAKALDRVDVFFGDPGRNDKSWVARALGLETPGARWTAPTFDKCLLLALIYPIITIIGVWVWSRHVGIAERVLGLWETASDSPHGGLMRLAFGLSLVAALYAIWRHAQADRPLPKLLWLSASAVLVAGRPLAIIGGVAAFGFAFAFGFAGAGAVAVASAVACAFVFGFAGTGAGAVALAAVLAAMCAVVFALLMISAGSVGRGWQSAFLSLLFLPATTLAVFVSVWWLSSSHDWPIAGSALLIFGVLTLVNAPFDWFAIGLTRALLRRGLAPGGQGPFFYAAVDAVVAPPVIALLAFVTVFAAQTFDDIAVLRAGPSARILPLDHLFAGLDLHPGDPEYWWVWLMLFSTLIPSALNLGVAAASLIRGLPFLNTWIVGRMSSADASRDSDRLRLASVLSAQIAGGFLATGLALYFLGVWLLPIWLPFLGGYVRDFSEALAAYNAPARIMMRFAGVR